MSKSDETRARKPSVDLWQLFQDLPDAYMLLDATTPDYTILEVNRARELLTGVSREQSVGRPLFQVFPHLYERFHKTGQDGVRRAIRHLIRTGRSRPLDVIHYEYVDEAGLRHSGYRRSVYQPLRAPDGTTPYILVSSHDVTREQRAVRQAESVEHRLEAALAVGKVSSWLWDIEADRVVGDKNLAKLFGLGPREISVGMGLREFLSVIYPEDRPRIDAAIRRSVREETPLDEEYRIVTAAGKMRWVLARGKAEKQDGRRVFPGVIVDVTERRDLQAQVELARRQDQLNRQAAKILQERNEELEAISQTKDEFVALASHQLRTPATAVKQYLGMVLQGYVGEITDVQTEMLEKAFESNERQLQIINQILNAARVDTGLLTMTTVPLDLRSLVQGIWDDMQPALHERKHQTHLSLPRNPVSIMGDLGYLRMAIENVVHNASVYTPEGGTITVRLARTAREARLSVTDTGVGIRKADLDKLFVKFSRIHNPLSVQAGGSGIGLYLTAEIVRLHGGRIDVVSKLRQGTTFTISLPLLLPGSSSNTS